MERPSMDDQNKNLLIASVLSFLVIVGWFFFFPPQDQVKAPDSPAGVSQTAPLTPPATGPVAEGTVPGGAPVAAAEAPRLAIDTPRLSGTVSLAGGRIDDLELDDYRETIQPDSPLVRLLSPVGGPGDQP